MTKAVKKSTKVSKKADMPKEEIEKYVSLTTSVPELYKFVKTASKKDLVELVLARTNLWAKKYKFTDEEVKRDPKTEKIEKMFQDGEVEFGCKNDRAIKLFSIILGEDICKKMKGSVEIDALIGIVPINCTNSHNYRVGTPIVTYKTGFAGQMRITGSTGNNLPEEASAYRVASKEEIKRFVDQTHSLFRKLV